jgi:D-inositol-3-phosphate glycosyltransferase
MRRVLEDRSCARPVEAGAVEQARHFSWERTAERTLETYEQAARLMREELCVAHVS